MPLARRLALPVLVLGLTQCSTLEADDAELARGRWNEVFAEAAERGVDWEASAFLGGVIADVPAGRALDIGTGQGRNALLLAERGWRVTGYDISDEALDQGRAAAEERGLEVEFVVGDTRTFDYGRERWDLVLAFYMHELVTPRLPEVVDSLAPGGRLVIEGFHWDAGHETFDGERFGFRTNELLRALDGLRILYYEDAVDVAPWGRRKPNPIVRIVALKE